MSIAPDLHYKIEGRLRQEVRRKRTLRLAREKGATVESIVFSLSTLPICRISRRRRPKRY